MDMRLRRLEVHRQGLVGFITIMIIATMMSRVDAGPQRPTLVGRVAFNSRYASPEPGIRARAARREPLPREPDCETRTVRRYRNDSPDLSWVPAAAPVR